MDDAAATAEIYVKFIEMLKERGMTTLKEVNAFGDMNPDAIKKMPTYHAIILAKNEVGRVNLYTLVSLSHLKYFARRPRIPKSEFNKYREADPWKCLRGGRIISGAFGWEIGRDNRKDRRLLRLSGNPADRQQRIYDRQ